MPVSLSVRSTSSTGPVSFYFVADAAPPRARPPVRLRPHGPEHACRTRGIKSCTACFFGARAADVLQPVSDSVLAAFRAQRPEKLARVRASASGRRCAGATAAERLVIRNLVIRNLVIRIGCIREDLSTGYGLRFSTDINGSKREKMVFHENLQAEISEHLRKPPGVYGRV